MIREDDTQWPRKNIVGKQELEIRLGNEHISFEVSRSIAPRLTRTDSASVDCQNRIPERRAGFAGPGWTASVLLFDSGSQGELHCVITYLRG